AEGLRARLTHHPAHPQHAGRLAGEDLATGIALELEVPAELQFTADRQEPPVDALGRGERVPHLLDIGPIDPAKRDRTAFTRRSRGRARAAGHRGQMVHHVLHAVSFSCFRTVCERGARFPAAASTPGSPAVAARWRASRRPRSAARTDPPSRSYLAARAPRASSVSSASSRWLQKPRN